MNKRSLISLCCAFIMLVVFLLGVMLFERHQARKEQNLHATATVYIPTTTTVPPTTEATEPPVVTAPEFIIADRDNRTYGILNFKGKPTILCFWKKEAEEELNLMQEFFDLYGEQANFVMIHLTDEAETKEDALAFVAQKGYTFPVYFDPMNTAADAYEVTLVPTTYFMNAKNVLKAHAQGALDKSALPTVLAEIGLTITAE